jgi:hypothetical protein
MKDAELALKEWQKKTEWVRKSAQTPELGMHLADVMTQRISRLHQQAERDVILLNRAEHALSMIDCDVDPTLLDEIRARLLQPGALPDLRD